MTGPAERSLNVGTIGPEPQGATPLPEEDLEGLIPDFAATRADLNRVEFESILRNLPRLLAIARSGGPTVIAGHVRYRRSERRRSSSTVQTPSRPPPVPAAMPATGNRRRYLESQIPRTVTGGI